MYPSTIFSGHSICASVTLYEFHVLLELTITREGTVRNMYEGGCVHYAVERTVRNMYVRGHVQYVEGTVRNTYVRGHVGIWSGL